MRITLDTDGPSDAALLDVIEWLMAERFPRLAFALRHHVQKRGRTLVQRIASARRQYPCDVLVVHRDVEGQNITDRREELEEAISTLELASSSVLLAPVRMTEAWFLIDEQAIRQAAGNPNGRMSLELPRLSRIEDLPDPKGLLHQTLRLATGRSGRRLEQFDCGKAVRRIPGFIESFEALRQLPAFVEFEQEFVTVVGSEAARLG